MMDVLPSTGTVLDALVTALQRCAVFNRNVMAPPACVLWPDETRQWLPVVRLLRERLPYLLTLGAYAPADRSGPAVWIRCLLAGELEAASWPHEALPIVYLPGVARATLRAIESCPRELQPLAELQYRGLFFSQQNSRDWTLLAFLRSKDGGLGLDVAQDARTVDALGRAALMLVDTPIAPLHGRRLEAADFDQILLPDPTRDLLRWLDDPAGTKAKWTSEHWGAFRSRCKETFGFDPHADGELVGAEHLGRKKGAWSFVWRRFAESPKSYPGLPDLLRRAEPVAHDMFEDRSSWPKSQETLENELRNQLLALETKGSTEAMQVLRDLEARHGERRDGVWAELGLAPLARALEHLAVMASVVAQPLVASKPAELAQVYLQGAWQADAAVLRALDAVERSEDVAAVREAIQTVYQAWLETSSERLQKLVDEQGYPGHAPAALVGTEVPAGQCILFADGLRFDVGRMLANALQRRGLTVGVTHRWAALPSVTPTCKAAVAPIAALVKGHSDDDEFLPGVAATGESLATHRFRKLLEDSGYQVLDREDIGNTSGRGWTEHGDLDTYGHKKGWKLARRIGEQLRELVERVESLLQAGWKKVVVVTDHGWLLLPGGLPKAQLANYLAATRWGRCAVLKSSAQVDSHVVAWRWSPDVRIALAPGIHCFVAGTEYAHGGLSLQECITPVLEVARPATQATVHLDEVAWRGMRCRVHASGSTAGTVADLRTKPADPQTTLCGGGKPLDSEGRTSLLVADDGAQGLAAFLVVLGPGGGVLAKANTCVGGGDT